MNQIKKGNINISEVDQHIGASVEVEFQQTNNDGNVEEMVTDNLIEYLYDVDEQDDDDNEQNVSSNYSHTPTTNESFVWKNEPNFAEEQYDDGGERYGPVMQCTMRQITSSATYIQYDVCTESSNYISGPVETDTNEYSDFTPDVDDDAHHKRSLVLAAIGQMENDVGPQEQLDEKNYEQSSSPPLSIQSADITQSGDITTTDDFQMDIQAEVNVETTGNNSKQSSENDDGLILEDVEIPLPPKRKRKVAPVYESYLKKRRMDGRNRSNVKTTPISASPSNGSTKVVIQFTEVKQPICKLAKAKEKRQPAALKTVLGPKMQLPGNGRTDKAANLLAVSGKNYL